MPVITGIRRRAPPRARRCPVPRKEIPMTRLHNGTFWTDAPPPAGAHWQPVTRWPLVLRIALILGVVVWLLAVVGIRSLFAQVPPTLDLRNGQVTSTIIRNP